MRPITTLYMLQSLDGKISTGSSDMLDFDADLTRIPMLRKGLAKYYEEEKSTDYWNLITAKTAVKLGANAGKFISTFHDCGHVLVDSRCITADGIRHVALGCNEMFFITTRSLEDLQEMCLPETVTVVRVHDTRETEGWISFLRDAYSIKHLTVEGGGEFNASMVRAGLIDRVIIYIAPILVGGSDTPTLVDGESFTTVADLSSVCKLSLNTVTDFYGFVRLYYKVIHK